MQEKYESSYGCFDESEVVTIAEQILMVLNYLH